ncbi:MAG: XrtA-associated tyrosine autokinase [Pseudomonadota bacterium]
MSLVETALKKLQSAQAGKAADAAGTARTPTLPDRAPTAAAKPLPAPTVLRKVSQHAPITVDRESLRAAGFLAPLDQERQIADQFRQIKRPLIANAGGRGAKKIQSGHLIMTASALPNEGKTFTSINLALSLALEQDITVLLVDADVAKRHISRIFGVEKEAGLLDALKDETLDLESLIIPTDIPGLNILPAGNRTNIATELLSSSHMERTVARLGAHSPNRIVLLDSPPLLLTSESRALAAIVGQVVVVVNAQSTPQQAVVDAVSHIPSDKSVGFILNQCNVRASEGYYYGDGKYGETHG